MNHQAHSKVKLSGHGQPTVPLYAKPNYGSAIAAAGVAWWGLARWMNRKT